MCQGLRGDIGRPRPDAIDARERPDCTLCLTYYYGAGERERHVPVDGTHAKKQASLRVLDVEERRREVQVRFRDVRRPERAAVADRLAGQAVHVVTMSNGPRARRVREAPWFIGIKQ